MSNNHVGEIVIGIGDWVKNFQYAVSSDANMQLEGVQEGNWKELSEESNKDKIAFYHLPFHGQAWYSVPFNNDESKSLFIKFDYKGEHFEYKLNPEGNMTNLAYELRTGGRIDVWEWREIALLAKNEDLEEAHLDAYTFLPAGIPNAARAIYIERDTSVGRENIYSSSFFWVHDRWDGVCFRANRGNQEGFKVDRDRLKKESVAILYTNDGIPKFEEIKWKGLEETISDLEARDGMKQEKTENEISNTTETQSIPKAEGNNNPTEEIPNGNINLDSAQTEPTFTPKQVPNVINNAPENTQPQQEPENPNITPEEPEKQNPQKGFFARLWDSIKNIFRSILRFFGIKVGEEAENTASAPAQNSQSETKPKEPDSLLQNINEMQQAQNMETDNKVTGEPVPLLVDVNTQQKTNSTVKTK